VVDTKPLLKGFGATADVAGQIATDKAVNSRRQSKGATAAGAAAQIAAGLTEQSAEEAGIRQGGVNIQDGELIRDHNMASGTPSRVPHNLGRVPFGALAIYTSSSSTAILCDVLHEDYVEFNTVSGTYSLWVF